MKKSLLIFIVILLIQSCKDGLNVHFNDKNALKIVEAQCKLLPDELCSKFKANYEIVLIYNTIKTVKWVQFKTIKKVLRI